MIVLIRLMFFLVLVMQLSACSYNTRDVVMPSGESVSIPEDLVFYTGLIDDIDNDSTILVSEMPGHLIRSMEVDPFAAMHHVVAYDKERKIGHRGQVFYIGKTNFMGIGNDGKSMTHMPCKRYLAVVIKNLNPQSDQTHISVVFGDKHAERFYDLDGKSVDFSQEDYESGKWEKVADIGTPAMKALMYDTSKMREEMQSWVSYAVQDPLSGKSWNMITPLQKKDSGESREASEQHTLSLLRMVSRKNEQYTISQKTRASMKHVVMSLNPWATGASIFFSLAQIPMQESHYERELTEASSDQLATRLQEEDSSCVQPKIFVPMEGGMKE